MGIRAVGYRSSNITIFYSTTEYEHDTNAVKQQQQENTPLKLAPWGSEKDHNGNSNVNEGAGSGSSEDQNKLFVGMLIMLIFSEALALYGLIVALIVSQSKYECG